MTVRALRLLTIAAIAALLALMLHLGQPGELEWWVASSPFMLWVIGPFVAPYLLALCFARSARFGAVMLAFLTLSVAAAAASYIDAFFVSTTSTSALALIFLPLYQWAALAVILLLTWLASLWTRRRKRTR